MHGRCRFAQPGLRCPAALDASAGHLGLSTIALGGGKSVPLRSASQDWIHEALVAEYQGGRRHLVAGFALTDVVEKGIKASFADDGPLGWIDVTPEASISFKAS